jgi:hypothetical protein
MNALPIGQVFALFDGLISYIELTNPWGGGADTTTAGGGDGKSAIGLLGPSVADQVRIVTPDMLPDDIRDLITG